MERKAYSFGELSKEAQQIVIEGHTFYLNMIKNREHTLEEVTNDLIVSNYRYYEGGNPVVSDEL